MFRDKNRSRPDEGEQLTAEAYFTLPRPKVEQLTTEAYFTLLRPEVEQLIGEPVTYRWSLSCQPDTMSS